ncbi:myotubularin-related protein 2-like isoform X2 [Corticium candelabrum]|uniref:myotubularin-related protein 2-like isoform X2 n=1 Tax=Corticium candelabrum TaxID=121492 RepID=UPI002E25FA63|nr:myotubularin-related protein 2-like isoform X2 [Corticium candelabrum]
MKVNRPTDLSMWIPFLHIISVERVSDDKVVHNIKGQKGVVTLVLKCYDFRTVRMTFMNQAFEDAPDAFHRRLSAMSVNTDRKHKAISPCDGEDHIVELQDVASSVETFSEEIDEMKATNISVCQFESQSGSADYSVAAGNVVVDMPCSSVISAAPVRSEQQKAYLKARLSTSAQASIRSMKEQIKSRAVFGQQSRSESAVEPLIKSFHDRLDYILLNPSTQSFAYVGESEVFEHLVGWQTFVSEDEFQRQQVNDKWKAYKLNSCYGLCPSYPPTLYLPANLKDETIRLCAEFRSKCRLPVLSWFNHRLGNFMMRSAQPKPGAMGRFSVEDEHLIEAARLCHPESSTLVIFDARSQVAAGGNMLKGLGTENTIRYRNCRLLHLDIGNIHAMRESIDKLRSAVCERTTELRWLSTLEDTQWLKHIATILTGATTVARYVAEKGAGVLVHCSDGWDRTSQLTSLSQLMLDSYYRTFEGFKVLVEKEWLSFGHKFTDRLGNPAFPNERSPVFLQFLDCTWQIMQQFPTAFEFNEDYLLNISEHFSSGWFGTFLMNTNQERMTHHVMTMTVSLWSHLDAVKETLLNPAYSLADELLKPLTSIRRLRLWNGYFLRYDESAWDVTASDAMEGDDDVCGGHSQKGQHRVNVVVWVPDKRAKVCYDCKLRFTRFRRRHHCRACGQVLCNECTTHRLSLPQFGYPTFQRVCDVCYNQHSASIDAGEYVVVST